MKFLQFAMANLVHIGPILLTAAFGLTIILERAHALLWVYSFRYTDSFFDKVRYFVMADRLNEALGLCHQLQGKPIVRVVKEGLLRAHQPPEVIEHGLHLIVDEETERIQARTGFLSTIANVATLLGLFGTILGLVHSFEAIGSASATERSAMLAAGISTAMNATMLGLGVAIPCMVAYSYLTYKATRLVAELERSALRTIDLLKQRYYGETAEAPVAPTRRDDGGSVTVLRPRA